MRFELIATREFNYHGTVYRPGDRFQANRETMDTLTAANVAVISRYDVQTECAIIEPAERAIRKRGRPARGG